MNRIEFQELMELARKSSGEKPRSELVVLALIFFNGGRIGINEIKTKVRSDYSSGWFSISGEEIEEILPRLISRNLLLVEEANYVVPNTLLSVLKDLIEENLFPERDEIIRNFEKLDTQFKDKLNEVISKLKDHKFYYYEDSELSLLRELEKSGLLIFGRSYFILSDVTHFGDSCVFVHPTTAFTVRSEFFKNEAFQLAEVHQEELLLLRKEKRELMEKVLAQQDRINSLYQENVDLLQRNRDVEEFQKGIRSGLFLKNMIAFRLKAFQERSSLDKLLQEWNDATTHDQIVHTLCQIINLFGLDSSIIEEQPAEPDALGISCYSAPPFLLLIEVKTLSGQKRLGTRETSQVISKVERYRKIYKGFKVLPIIITNVEANRISVEAIRDCRNNATILTKSFVSDLLASHFKHKYTAPLLYMLLEPKDNPIPSADSIKFMNALSEQENARIGKEVILSD